MALPTPKFILIVDWETSGTTWVSFEQTFKEYQGITFGAVVADAETRMPVKTLYCEIQFDETKYKWSAEAEAIHGKTREYLKEHGMTKEDAALALASLIMEYFGTGKIMFGGHNAGFDIEATKQLLGEFEIPLNLHHIVLDTAPLGMAIMNIYKSDRVFELLGEIGARGQHNALEDALVCLTVLRNVKALFDTFDIVQ